jgi:hypothetical protein
LLRRGGELIVEHTLNESSEKNAIDYLRVLQKHHYDPVSYLATNPLHRSMFVHPLAENRLNGFSLHATKT